MAGLRALRNEEGIILITSLVLLVVLTLIGIVAMQSTTMQERMAGNIEQRDQAFETAEAGLRLSERELDQWVVLPPFDGKGTAANGLAGLYTPGDTDTAAPEVWWNNADKYRNAGGARCIIEYMLPITIGASDSVSFGALPEVNAGMYRIRARAASPNGLAVVILEATYVR
jgi:type IV pilus assembly protein PilX